MFKWLHRFRLFLARLLGGGTYILREECEECEDADVLHQFLHAPESQAARKSFELFFRPDDKRAGYVPESDSRPFLERAYADAQKHGSERNGWRLRFILYYHLGKMDGLW